jgi:hypothetical protein
MEHAPPNIERSPEDQMKAISVQQPWAWAILHAGKDLENRQVRFKYRGPLLIHAPLHLRAQDRMPPGVRQPKMDELPCGVVLDIVDLVDVVNHARSKWWGGKYALSLRNPRRLKKPIPCKGVRGLWTPSPSLIRAVKGQLS